MALQEISFETLLIAVESARGTPEAAPTVIANTPGTAAPKQDVWRPDESTGTLAAYHRSKVTRRWSEFTADGPFDSNLAAVLFQSLIGQNTTPTTPTNGVLTRDWDFTPNMTADDVEGLSLWSGDPNIQKFRHGFGIVEEATIASDATGSDGTTISFSGRANFPTKVSSPSVPAINNAPLFESLGLQLWIDDISSDPIGTTAVTGEIVSAEHVITLEGVPKWIPAGPASSLDFTDLGRLKRFATTTIQLLVPDMTRYDHFADQDTTAVRVRHNGPQIEAVTPTYYHHFEFDAYGTFDLTDLGDYDGANRLWQIEIMSEYDATLAADWRAGIRSTLTAIP